MPADTVVFFDVGGTLLEVSPSVGHVYSAACARLGAMVEPASLQHAFDKAWVQLGKEVPRGANRYQIYQGGETEWWERVSAYAFDQCSVPASQRPPVDDLRAVFAGADAWHVYPETREVLCELRARGCRLGVISNWDSRLPRLLATLGLDGHFDAVVTSAGAGVEKPHPAIFAAALEALGAEPSRSVHIGDRLDEDYAGARQAGLRALLLSRNPANETLINEVSRWGNPRDLVADLREALQRIVS